MSTRKGLLSAIISLLMLVPSAAWAQSQSTGGISGLLRDSSGAVLPGVTVEVASPALIEKVRIAVTDGDGRYSVVDLRPGTYSVAFSLAGFRILKREGIQLTAGFTATVSADMQVGALEETITVTGESPLVDVQNVGQQKVISDELMAALPTNKSLSTALALVPGLVGTADVGGASGIYTSNAVYRNMFHGKAGGEYSVDGMNTVNMGFATSYIVNPATIQEMVVDTGGASAENGSAAGPSMNMVPKEGGNQFRFLTNGRFVNDKMQSDNLDQELIDRGLTTTNGVLRSYDFNVTVGGPIKRNRLWFFGAARMTGAKMQVGGVYFNKTQGTPVYTPDRDRPAYRDEWLKSVGGRLTWQVSPRNKVSVFADPQAFFVRGRGEFTSPEAGNALNFFPSGLYQVSWNSPRTSKLLLEAGYSMLNTENAYPSPGDGFMKVNPNDISILEQTTGFRYNARPSYTDIWTSDRWVEKFSASYVTGAHAFKTGIQIEQGFSDQRQQVQGDVTYTFRNGAPISLTEFATPYLRTERVKPDLGLFAQDRWTLNRLTLTYGVRFEYFNSYVPAQSLPATRFVPARSFDAVHDVPKWFDLNPRVGAAFDLFGNSRTVLKASVGRYVEGMGTSLASSNNPINTSVNSVTRTWNDNGNFVPDCNLNNPALNGECGPISDTAFGGIRITTTYADDVIRGFGARNATWDISMELQHQFTGQLSMSTGYYRNWAANFRVTDNLLTTSADFDTYCITAPQDQRLPGGGGYQVCGLYDVTPAKFGRSQNVVTQASNFFGSNSSVNCGSSGSLAASGGAQQRIGSGCGAGDFVAFSLNSRFGSGINLGGGIDTGRIVIDNCLVIDSPQQMLNCRVVRPFRSNTDVKLYASYPLPWDINLSGVFQNVPGPMIEATYAVTNTEIAKSLGRNLSSCGAAIVCTATATVPLIKPGTMFEGRRTQLDARLSKIFKMGSKTRLQANLDIYNMFNGNAVLSTNPTYGPRWRQPIVAVIGTEAVLQGRLIQLSGELSF